MYLVLTTSIKSIKENKMYIVHYRTNSQDPVQIELGSEHVCKIVKGHQTIVEVKEFFTYIPLLNVLQGMLRNDKIYDEVRKIYAHMY